MYCNKCGKEIDDRAVICPHCGCPVRGSGPAADDAPSAGFAVLCAFIPVVGLILYLMWEKEYPQKARSAGKGALIGVIVAIGVYISLFVMVMCMSISLVDVAAVLTVL